MPTSTISTQPASKFNWADDDEDDDFDLEAWKATADISAPSAESMPPLQLDDSSSPCYTTIHTSTSALAPETSPYSTCSPPPTPSPAAAIPAAVLEQYHAFTAVAAWRALHRVPDPPAYPELSEWKGIRQYYAREWKNMKVRSGADCRYLVMYRCSLLRWGWTAEYEEEMQGVVRWAPNEPYVADKDPVVVLQEEKDAESEVVVPILEFQEEEAVTVTDLVHEEDLEPTQCAEEADLESPIDVSPPTTAADIEISVGNGDRATANVPDASLTDNMECAIESPINTSSIQGHAPTSDGAVSPPAIAIDNDAESVSSFGRDIEDPFLSDWDSDSDASSVSSLSLPISALDITISLDTLPKKCSPKVISSSPPLSPIYNATHIGLSTAFEFIKKQQAHKRHDSQEALDELNDGLDDIDGCHELCDSGREPPRKHETNKDERQEEYGLTYVCDKVAQGWGYLSNMSWMTTAAVIGVGMVLGGALRAARRH